MKQTENRLQELREAAEVSRASIADQLGVSEHSVWRWEREEIPAKHLPTLAKLFGCSVDHLIGMDRQSPNGHRAAA